ncbi:MAG: nucleotidyltransferase family protein [Acidobacteriales bacterium]|nr:nucleotidyltransferase family protein [Terriglobales bacterium]
MKPWDQNRTIPRWAAALFEALRFSGGSTEALEGLGEADWKKLLAFTDRTGLTLVFGRLCEANLPDGVRERIESDFRNNCRRYELISKAHLEIAAAFEDGAIEFLVLKGLTQLPDFCSDPRLRVQYDVDVYCPQEHVLCARDALAELGYEAATADETAPVDHLPTMIRKTDWRWRGDYFDPEIPPAVDVHFRLWDPHTEHFKAPGVDEFWPRRDVFALDGHKIPTLCRTDALAYSALHMLRHWFRGSLPPRHVYELAYFLENHAENEAFWSEWLEQHPPELRRLQSICFRLSSHWFGCRMHPIAESEMRLLSDRIKLWFEHHSASPVEALFSPNKDEVWLHLGLIEAAGDRRKVLLRRALPTSMPPRQETYLPETERTWRTRLESQLRYGVHVLRRSAHHAQTLPRLLWAGRHWIRRQPGMGWPFWRFMAAASFFNLGMSGFTLLYNLYLLGRGLDEAFLGLVAGAAAAGSIAATLPAALLMRRWGLRRTLLLCFSAAGPVAACRVIAHGSPALLGTAFLGGAVLSLFAVSLAPAIADLAPEAQRVRGFSLFFGWSITLGVLAGFAFGRFPGWLSNILPSLGGHSAMMAALLLACGLASLAPWPAWRLRLPVPIQTRNRYPGNPFVVRFLAILAVWNLATGAFNPFFNAYFARRVHLSVEHIGALFSTGQLAQVGALLIAPFVLRRFGLVKGIAGMQIAAGVALGSLAGSTAAAYASASYAAFVALQYMSEPGAYSLLMSKVSPGERGGASALNFLAAFGAQALAAGIAGAGYARFGYAAVLWPAAGLMMLSGLLFRTMLREPNR